MQLIVEDDGMGFDLAAAQQRAYTTRRLGLIGMQERAHLKGQVVGTTLCGGNVDASVFAEVIS